MFKMPEKVTVRKYTAKSGKTQFKASLRLIKGIENDSEGFCLACGGTQSCVEPDAVRYECEACGEAKVYGPEYLVLLNLVF